MAINTDAIMNTSIFWGIMLISLCFCSNWFVIVFFALVLVGLIIGVVSMEMQNWKNEKENRESLKIQMKNAKRFSLN